MNAIIRKFARSITLSLLSIAHAYSAEQDNWYLLKQWNLDEDVQVNGMCYEHNESTGSGHLFLATNRGILVYDLNGSLQTRFGDNDFNDVTIDENGTVYGTRNDHVIAYEYGPGRVVSVNVEHSGSNYYDHSYQENWYGYQNNLGEWRSHPYLEFNGTGTGAKAVVLMDENGSDFDDYNRYAKEVRIIHGGSGYSGEVNATLNVSNQDGFSYNMIQIISDTNGSFHYSIHFNAGDIWPDNNFKAYQLSEQDAQKLTNDYNSSYSSYVENDVVRYNGMFYSFLTDGNASHEPTNDASWQNLGNSLAELKATGIFDMTDVSDQVWDRARFSVTIGNGWSEKWSKNLNNSNLRGISVDPQTGEICVTNSQDHVVQFLDRNGTLLEKQLGTNFSEAPGSFRSPYDIGFLPDGRMLVSDDSMLHWFDQNGSFLKRIDQIKQKFAVSPSGIVLGGDYYSNKIYDWNGESMGVNLVKLTQGENGQRHQGANYIPKTFATDSMLVFGGRMEVDQTHIVRVFKRAYRTKGLPVPNELPEPVIHSVSQRSGTNIVDIEFEITDPDDDNATVGILAAENGNFDNPSSWIVPATLVDGTAAKLGLPITTNQPHTISWNIGEDWESLTGNLKFKVICQDARRSSPVDIHFLQLPLEDGNITISRSPVQDVDIRSYYRFLLGSLDSNVYLNEGRVEDVEGTVLVESGGQSTDAGRERFIEAVGERWASYLEVWSAKQGAVPGSVESRSARNPIIPRNLPSAVNEYGFDVGNYGNRAWWIVSESTLATYTFDKQIIDFNGTNYSRFGSNVALSGSNLVIGNSSDNWETQKKVFVYPIDPITKEVAQDAIVVEPLDKDLESSNGFGRSIAISGNYLVVGAPNSANHRYDEYNNIQEWRYDCGSVYVFDLSSGSAVQTGKYDSNYSNAQLGQSLDINGSWVVAGAPNRSIDGESGRGSACLLQIESNGSIGKVEEIIDTEGQYNDGFASVVSIGYGQIAISAPRASSTNQDGIVYGDAGKVFLFSYTDEGTIESMGEVTNQVSNNYWGFGNVLDLSDGVLVVGHNNEVQVFHIDDLGNTTFSGMLSSITENSGFASKLALSGNRMVVHQNGVHIGWDPNTGQVIYTPSLVYYYQMDENGVFKFKDALEFFGGSGNEASLSIHGRYFAVGDYGFDGADQNGNYLYDLGRVHFVTSEQ
jgi:hypothetical protein